MIPYPETLWQIILMAMLLIAAVINAVHQAEVIAHKIGEPLGTLVLAISVTIIEVALIVSIMLSAGADGALIARDSVFAAVMIVMNGVIGVFDIFRWFAAPHSVVSRRGHKLKPLSLNCASSTHVGHA